VAVSISAEITPHRQTNISGFPENSFAKFNTFSLRKVGLRAEFQIRTF